MRQGKARIKENLSAAGTRQQDKERLKQRWLRRMEKLGVTISVELTEAVA
jgi:hypothetical protein